MVVQLVRISACHAEGRGFESRPHRPFKIYNTRLKILKIGAVVQSVRISACHAEGRGFESRPHRKKDCFERSDLFSFKNIGLSCRGGVGFPSTRDPHRKKASKN